MALLSPLAHTRWIGPLVVGALLALPAAGGSSSVLHAQHLTQDEALALAFPGAEIDRRTAYLEEAQIEAARTAAGAGVEVRTGVVTHYVAHRGGSPVGVAYFDAHRVRTLEEVLMIVIDPSGAVVRVETVVFREPPEYEAPEGWLDLIDGRQGPPARVVRDLPNLAGATLTADAVKGAVRRTLALHGVIAPFGPGAPSSPDTPPPADR